MKNRSFTLIELLIVIVVIGVLAILAIPMYKLFVYRAQGAEAKRNLMALADSAWRYYFEAGKWPEDKGALHSIPEDLDISIKSPSKYFSYYYVIGTANDAPPAPMFGAMHLNQNEMRENGPAGAVFGYYIMYGYEPINPRSSYIAQGVDPSAYDVMSGDWYRIRIYDYYESRDNMEASGFGWP